MTTNTRQLSKLLDYVKNRRQNLDRSLPQKQYTIALRRTNALLTKILEKADQNPEEALVLVRQCAQFALKSMPGAGQYAARATSLSQFRTLETMLAEVRRPDEYLANMKEQFGTELDPRTYKLGHDAFSNIIKSQRNRLYAEGQGFDTHEEKLFCRKRSELLAVVENAYKRLRDQALGMPAKAPQKGRGR